MQTKRPEKNSTRDLLEFVQDLTDRWRYLYKLTNDLDACQGAQDSAERQAFLGEFAKVFADVMDRERFLEVCKRNGENVPAGLSRLIGTA